MDARITTGRLHIADHRRVPRIRSAVVDQHATWIAVNPIQGCPKACAYCFLNERGQTAVRPDRLVHPAETVDMLLSSRFYAPDRPVAMYTWTDVMALASSRAHLAELLVLLAERKLPNPVVLITKCLVPDETLEAMVAARQAGTPLIAYVSYSGLDRGIERGIRREEVKANFPRLAESGVPVVHYWRPAFPESATVSRMEAVFDWAATYARCTVAAGLKVEPAALDRLSTLWPQLASTPGVIDAECVYPQAFWDFIHATGRRRADYPLFHTNSCALAYVLAQPDRFGVFGGEVCRSRNHCPSAQRRRCQVDVGLRPLVTERRVRAALEHRGYPEARFTLDRARGEVVIDSALPTCDAAALTRDLSVRVRVARQDDDYYWSSGTAGAMPLVIGDGQ